MRADLIERLRNLAIRDCEWHSNPKDHLAWEAADALASQEPVRWCMSPADPGECEDYTADASVAAEWQRRGLCVTPLFASPVVPVAAKAEAEGWRLIETAPKDGSLILLSDVDWPPSKHLGKPTPVKVGGFWDDRWNVFGSSWQPTHWMPLPAAPTCEGEGTP